MKQLRMTFAKFERVSEILVHESEITSFVLLRSQYLSRTSSFIRVKDNFTPELSDVNAFANSVTGSVHVEFLPPAAFLQLWNKGFIHLQWHC